MDPLLLRGDEEDCFQRLPDALLLLIFDKLTDAKSLARCLSVSKRFSSLIPQTHSISLALHSHNNRTPSPQSILPSSPFYLLKIFYSNFVAKSFSFLYRRFIAPKSRKESSTNLSYYSIQQVLNHFKEVKSLEIELPPNDLKVGLETSCSLLKWKAEFGCKLKCCIIFGAMSSLRSEMMTTQPQRVCETTRAQLLTGEEMKLRIVWAISCLVTASTRHCLVKQVIAPRNKIENVVITDVKKQGKLQMGREEVVELRKSVEPSLEMRMDCSPARERTQVPDLSIRMWHAPVLELAETGYVMKGATLIVIRPIDLDGEVEMGTDGGDLFGCEEEDAISEGVREILKLKRSYAMTMDGF